MKASARAARRITRDAVRARRARRQATRAVATGAPQPATTHMLAAGMDQATAKQFAGAFSRGVVPAATGRTVIKLKGRRTKAVDVKLYTAADFADRAATYRPKKDQAAAAKFARLAVALAA